MCNFFSDEYIRIVEVYMHFFPVHVMQFNPLKRQLAGFAANNIFWTRFSRLIKNKKSSLLFLTYQEFFQQEHNILPIKTINMFNLQTHIRLTKKHYAHSQLRQIIFMHRCPQVLKKILNHVTYIYIYIYILYFYYIYIYIYIHILVS